LPLLKEGANAIGTEAVKTIANVANDTLEGSRFGDSIRSRSKEAISSLVDKVNGRLQKGEGFKRKKRGSKRKKRCLKTKKNIKKRKPVKRKKSKSLDKKKVKRQRTKLDIFDSL
jgi:hypothetical protein